MSMVIAWLLFPAVIAALSLGCGLAVERAARVRLPGVLLIPLGLAAVIVAAQLATATDATAELAAPLVVLVAAAGLALSPPWRQRARFDGWAFLAAAGVFAVFAAPVVLSGQATFAGFIKLDDTSAWLGMTDHVMQHGRNVAGLAPSSYQTSLALYLNGGYPVGSFLPLGVGAWIVAEDPAWLFQPWLSLLAAMLALVLNRLLVPVVPGSRLRALYSFIAAQPALLYGYAMWGGVKELATAWVVALVAALVPAATRHSGPRSAVPLAVGVAATLAIASLAGAVWVAPAVACALVVAARRRGARPTLRLAGGLMTFGLVLALPSLALARTFVPGFAGQGKLLTNHVDIGNLFGPLNPLQVLGVWPSGDFRVQPHAFHITHWLIIVVGAAALAGVLTAVKRRAGGLVLYACATAAIGLAVAATAGPWVAAKGLVIASPAVLVLACAGAGEVWRRGRRAEASVVAAAIAGGVLWSNALAYHDVNLAPRDHLAELERIGKLAAGQGPTLMTEYNPNGVRHFLRAADGEGISELRSRTVLLHNGQAVSKLNSADTDDLQVDGLFTYRTLVVRRSPVASRPPAAYRLVWRGQAYEMWQRAAEATRPLGRLPLGRPLSAAARPRCADVRRLGARAGREGLLAAVRRPMPAVANLRWGVRPATWGKDPGNGSIVFPTTSGTLRTQVTVSKPGAVEAWIGGSSRGLLALSIDGRRVGSVRGVLNNRGAYMPMGRTELEAGRHEVTISYRGGGLRPGTGGQGTQPFFIGPLVLSPAADTRRVTYTPAAEWRRLCGGTLDWIEALRAR